MKGLHIRFEEQCDNIVKRLLKGIKFDEYDFDINLIESYEEDMGEDWEDLSEIIEITTQQAKKRLLEIDDACAAPEFLELFIRLNKSKKIRVTEYDDFLKSDYIMSFIIIDHRNIEICCKNEEWLEHIVVNLENLHEKLNLKYKRLSNIKSNARLIAGGPSDSISIYD